MSYKTTAQRNVCVFQAALTGRVQDGMNTGNVLAWLMSVSSIQENPVTLE